MTVFRVHKTRDYTVMSNRHLRDGRLSLKAKGLLSVVLSLPDDWEYSIAGLAAICKEGVTAVKSAMSELREYGYITVTKQYPGQTESGRIEYVYDIHEEPQPPDIQPTEKQGVENLPLEKQYVEKPTQLNTDNKKDGKASTEEKSTEEQAAFAEIIGYLNEKTGKRFKPGNERTRKMIRARFSEGYTVEDFRCVIDNKCATWKGDPKMDMFLRPQTLFRPSHFEAYLNERRADDGNAYGDAWALYTAAGDR